MIEILLKSIKDIFDKKIFFTALIPVLIASAFWGFVFLLFYSNINEYISSSVNEVPFLPQSGWFSNIIGLILVSFFYYQLVILTSVTLVGIVADKIVERINEKYYSLQKEGFSSTMTSIFISIKQNIIFVLLFILTLPTIFIPLLNLIVTILLWMLLIKKPMFYDSLSLFATKEEYSKLQESDKIDTFMITFLSASLFFIPIFGVFVYILQLLMFTHFNLSRLRELRIEHATRVS